MGDNSFKKIDLQLVFDTNILVDALISRGSYFHYTVDLLAMVEKGHVEGWYAPHTLTTVYYLLTRTLAKDAPTRKDAIQAARSLLNTMVDILKPLPQVGNEIADIDAEAGDDLEDLLIMKLATDYLPESVARILSCNGKNTDPESTRKILIIKQRMVHIKDNFIASTPNDLSFRAKHEPISLLIETARPPSV